MEAIKRPCAFIKTLSNYNTKNITFLNGQIKLFSDGAIYSQAMQMKEGYTDGHQGEWMTPFEYVGAANHAILE